MFIQFQWKVYCGNDGHCNCYKCDGSHFRHALFLQWDHQFLQQPRQPNSINRASSTTSATPRNGVAALDSLFSTRFGPRSTLFIFPSLRVWKQKVRPVVVILRITYSSLTLPPCFLTGILQLMATGTHFCFSTARKCSVFFQNSIGSTTS